MSNAAKFYMMSFALPKITKL